MNLLWQSTFPRRFKFTGKSSNQRVTNNGAYSARVRSDYPVVQIAQRWQRIIQYNTIGRTGTRACNHHRETNVLTNVVRSHSSDFWSAYNCLALCKWESHPTLGRTGTAGWVRKARVNISPTWWQCASDVGVLDRYPKHESDQKNYQGVFDQTLAFFLNNQSFKELHFSSPPFSLRGYQIFVPICGAIT